jgi:hypothetical protein
LEVDYATHAEAEAELGWLNSSLAITAAEPFPLDDLLVGIVDHLRTSLARIEAETAHVKTVGIWEGLHGVANLISSDSPVELSLASHCRTREAEVIINARVAVDPEILREHVQAAVQGACQAFAAAADFRDTQQLRPGRPAPTYRLDDVAPGDS